MPVSLPSIKKRVDVTRVVTVPEELDVSEIDRDNIVVGGGSSSSDRGTNGLLLLGIIAERQIAKRNYVNAKTWMDVSSPKIVFVCGRRGQGKSYTLGTIAEGLAFLNKSKQVSTTINGKIAVVLIDSMGQFWTMAFSPDANVDDEEKKQLRMLAEWGLQPDAISNVSVLVPRGARRSFTFFSEFTIKPNELTVEDWCGLFDIDPYVDPMGHLLSTAYRKVVLEGYEHASRFDSDTGDPVNVTQVNPKADYTIEDLMNCIGHDVEINSSTGFKPDTIRALRIRLEEARAWNIFGKSGIDLSMLLKGGAFHIVDLSSLEEKKQALITGILTRKIYHFMRGARNVTEELQRKKSKKQKETSNNRDETADIVWLMVDEAHVMCPARGSSLAKKALITYAKQGRRYGLSLALATQRPSAVDNDLISQKDVLVCHQLGLDPDIESVISNFGTEVPSVVKVGGREVTSSPARYLIRRLRRGEVLVAVEGEVNRVFLANVRPRLTVHGGREPRVA